MDKRTEIKKNIKRCQSNIKITGLGVLVFGLWNVLKFIIQIIYGSIDIARQLSEIELDPEIDPIIVPLATFFLILFVSLVIIVTHCFIGLRAIGYGRGVRKKWGFLIFAGIIAVITAIGIPGYFRSADGRFFIDDTVIAAALVDLTLFYILCDMIFSAIGLKIFNKKLEQEQ